MVVKAKINKKSIEEVLNKGADVVQDRDTTLQEEWKMISVRLPKSLLETMDKHRSSSIGLTRNAWILQKFQEILKENGMDQR